MAWHILMCHGVAWCVAWHIVVCHGVAWRGVVWNGMAWHIVMCHSVACGRRPIFLPLFTEISSTSLILGLGHVPSRRSCFCVDLSPFFAFSKIFSLFPKYLSWSFSKTRNIAQSVSESIPFWDLNNMHKLLLMHEYGRIGPRGAVAQKCWWTYLSLKGLQSYALTLRLVRKGLEDLVSSNSPAPALRLWRFFLVMEFQCCEVLLLKMGRFKT